MNKKMATDIVISAATAQMGSAKRLEEIINSVEIQRLISLVRKRAYSSSDLVQYFEALRGWLDHGDFDPLLLSMRDVFAALNPASPIPDFLWRGLGNLNKLPKKGQKVVYGTGRKYAHFSEEQSVAEEFANFNDHWVNGAQMGIVLKVAKREIDKQIVFIWPIKKSEPFYAMGIGDTYMHEKEWGIHLRVPMKVAGWYTKE